MKLTSTTSPSIVKALKGIFARHGIPEVLRSDNGLQFDSEAMTVFASEYEFSHITRSPRYVPTKQRPGWEIDQDNQTAPQEIRWSFSYTLLLQTTPLQWCGYSPSELLMGRRLRTTLPQVQELLVPNGPIHQSSDSKTSSTKISRKRTMTDVTEFHHYQNYLMVHQFSRRLETLDPQLLWLNRPMHQDRTWYRSMLAVPSVATDIS